MTARRARFAGALAVALLAAAPAAAQLKGVEAEGAVPVPAQAFTAAALRAKAQEAALREAVIQVAETMATPPPSPGATPPPAGATSPAPGTAPPGTTPAPGGGAPSAPGASPVAERVRAAFADSAPLDYTPRYRVIQDVGIRPRQRIEDPAVAQEYAVRVEAQVDAGRVRKKLAAAGLLPAPPKELVPTAAAPSSFSVVVEGLPSAGAIPGIQQALAERSRAKQVLPTTISAREVTFAVTAGQVGADPGAVLRGPAGTALWLEPAPRGEPGAPLRMLVTEPPPITSSGAEPPSATPTPAPPAPTPAAAAPARPLPAPGSVPPSAGPSKPAPSPARD